MDMRRSTVDILNLDYTICSLIGFLFISSVQLSFGATNPADIAAINNLYVSLGTPLLLHQWTQTPDGDPCGDGWQGVSCIGSVINSIIINGANLGGELGNNLGIFSSIKKIDFRNNQIGGSIPSNLPMTLQQFFLSDNHFTGSIPISLSYLSQLSNMSLNGNFLSGDIPDSFVPLTNLINLDLSHNNLNGVLPPSLKSLSSLTSLQLQNNQLSGTLDVLLNLPLRDLNVENNLFGGAIPDKLLSIPNFKKNGNHFMGIAPASPPISLSILSPPPPSPPSSRRPQSVQKPRNMTDQHSNSDKSSLGAKRIFFTTKRIVWISIAGLLICIIVASGFMILFSLHVGRKHANKIPKPPENAVFQSGRVNSVHMEPFAPSVDRVEKVSSTIARPNEEHQEQLFPPTPSPPPLPLSPLVGKLAFQRPPTKNPNPATTAKQFTIATLQQYTNSFSEENIIGEGLLGSVYRGQLPDGKLLAVKNLEKAVVSHLRDGEFHKIVNNIHKIRHSNVVDLMGYCAEHGQCLLIYKYCSNGTLKDALHDKESKMKLSWNARVQIALGSARALWYLHEVCDPPVVHQNFKSSNVLLDGELSAFVSDCGLGHLVASRSVVQLSGHLQSAYGYAAPEFLTGASSCQSDVYSFGVVMLELLTGRQPYDGTRHEGEKVLVRWAVSQLHDIDLLSKMVDPSLNGEYQAKSLSRFADIISRCLQAEPEFRPAMCEVVQYLVDMLEKEHGT